MPESILHVMVCLGGSWAIGFAAAWLWRGIAMREAVRHTERIWQGMVAAREVKNRELEQNGKRLVAVVAAKEADLETLRIGFADAEKMFDKDVLRHATEASQMRVRAAALDKEWTVRAREFEVGHNRQISDRDREIASLRTRLAEATAASSADGLALRACRVEREECRQHLEDLAARLAAEAVFREAPAEPREAPEPAAAARRELAATIRELTEVTAAALELAKQHLDLTQPGQEASS